MRIILILFSALLFFSCKDIQNSPSIVQEKNITQEVKYAEGFSINTKEGYTIISISNPWPGADQTFDYLLEHKDSSMDYSSTEEFFGVEAIVNIPVFFRGSHINNTHSISGYVRSYR